MLTFALLAGIWSTTCIQTQISNDDQGFARETYTFTQTGTYEFKLAWFRDPECTDPKGTDTESGTFIIGKKINGLFITQETYEADFSSQAGLDLGAISAVSNKLRVSRGVRNSTMRNTMLGLFEYSKRD